MLGGPQQSTLIEQGTGMLGGLLGGPATQADHKVSSDLQAYWTNFARSGDPNGAGLPVWPRFDPKERKFLEFAAGGPVVAANLRQEICALYMDNLRHSMQRP